LLDPASGAPIALGTIAWQRWLEHATSFAYLGSAGRFTARKERRGRADGHWRAYRRRGGKLYSAYLGQSADLTPERLEAVAQALAGTEQAVDPPADQQIGSTARTADEQAPGTGTITVLLADADPFVGQDPIPDATRAHMTTLLTEAIRAGGGESFDAGAGVLGGSFGSPIDALDAALTARRALAAADLISPWPSALRMALHARVATAGGDDQRARLVRWAARLLASGPGGQILLSHISGVLISEQLPVGFSLYNLGAYYFGDGDRPESCFQLVGPGLPASAAPLRPPARRPHNLPAPATSLVGREGDIASVKAALQRADVRLLTLIGPGGVGKTRLALQVARELRDSFADGAFLVDLAAIVDPALVIPKISKTLGLVQPGEQEKAGLKLTWAANSCSCCSTISSR
jgi:hypothetical protein